MPRRRMSGTPRRSRLGRWWHRRATHLLLTCTGMSVAVSWVMIASGAEHEEAHHAAADLAERGRTVTVTDVEIHVLDGGRRGPWVDDVRVTFTLDGRTVTTLLMTGPLVEDVQADHGWQRPPPTSKYAPPLEVLTLPGHPEVTMATADIGEHRTSEMDTAIVGATLFGAIGAVSGTAAWRRLVRPGTPGRHQAGAAHGVRTDC